jgi:hypothetical protein
MCIVTSNDFFLLNLAVCYLPNLQCMHREQGSEKLVWVFVLLSVV